MGKLDGKKIAFVATDGVEQVELTEPRDRVVAEGAQVELLSIGAGKIQATRHDIEPADTFGVDKVVGDVEVDDYDALILPGGASNPDKLRGDADAVAFVRAFVESGKPVAAICHAPWTLVEADVVRGRTLTSWPTVRTDIRNAGGTVVDEEVVRDGNLTTSRSPDDLPAFCDAIVAEFAA
jgi:protease I